MKQGGGNISHAPVLSLDEVDVLAAEVEIALATGIEVDHPLHRRHAVVVGVVVEAVGHVLAEGGGEEARDPVLAPACEECPVLVGQCPAAEAHTILREAQLRIVAHAPHHAQLVDGDHQAHSVLEQPRVVHADGLVQHRAHLLRAAEPLARRPQPLCAACHLGQHLLCPLW